MSRISGDLTILVFSGGIVAILFCFWLFGAQLVEADLVEGPAEFTAKDLEDNLITIQGNSLVGVGDFSTPEKVVKKINVIATGYSSSPEETDGDPFTTASGTKVREEIIANNLLPFGTKVRIPEIYGDQVFVVEDRMHWKKGYYHIDIWFPSKEEAEKFGAKRTYIEVLEG